LIIRLFSTKKIYDCTVHRWRYNVHLCWILIDLVTLSVPLQVIDWEEEDFA